MTDESRKDQIEKALAARAEQPETDRHSHPLVWRNTAEKHFPVVDLPLDVPLLWPDSHRIRAELEASEYEFVRKERTSARAQEALQGLWKKAHRKFEKLKESLLVEGQTEPGVITREGVLINGNTRLVALRELGRQWIRVAVLDSDARPFELAELELRLQVRETGHDSYRLSNELLFIDEMSWEYHRTDEEIARQLNWTPARPALGKRKVDLHRRLLALIREMQRRDPRLPITFFDDEGRGTGKLQQLKELEQRYNELISSGETDDASLRLDTWLIVARSGFSSVHQIRAVVRRDDFVPELLLPRLGEQELFGEQVDALVQASAAPEPALPGMGDLGTDARGPASSSPYDLHALLELVEAKEGSTVVLRGGDGLYLDAGRVQAAIRAAVEGAVRDHRAEDRAEDALDAPVDALRKAIRELKKAIDTYSDLQGTKEFERQTRGAFEYQLRHVRKTMNSLEDLVAVRKEKAKGVQ